MYSTAASRGRSFASSAAASIVLRQQKVGTTADASGGLVVNFDATATIGNIIVACISFVDGAAFGLTPPTLNAEGPLNDTGAVGVVTATLTTLIYWMPPLAAPGNDSITFTLDLPVRASMHISEWSVSVPWQSDDISNADTQNSSALGVVPATLDPPTAPNLVIGIGAYVSADNDYSSGPSNGFTRLTPTGGAAIFQECAYLIRETDHAAVTSVVTLDEADVWCSCAAAFVIA